MRTWITMVAAVCGLALAMVSCKNENTTTGAQPGSGVLTGTVLDATSQAPVVGARVTGQSVSLGVQTQTTGTAGTFSFTFSFTTDSVANVLLTISRAGYLDTTMTITVRSNTVKSVTVLMVSKVANGPGIVNGVVKDQSTGTALQGVTVNATSLTLDPQTTTTSAGGLFSFTFPVDTTAPANVPATVTFAIKQPGYRDTSVTLQVYFGKTTALQIRIVPRSAALIGGTVTDSKNGQNISAAKVKVVGLSGAPVTTDSTTTDILGRYQLPVMINAKAIVSLTFSKVGYRDSTTMFEVVPSESPVVNLALVPKAVAASLHGVVTDGKNPVVGASVAMQFPSGTIQNAVSNILGEFDFVALIDSSTIVQLVTSKPSYRTDTTYIRITPSASQSISISLVSTMVAVNGLVNEIGGSGLSGVVVTAKSPTIGTVVTSTDLLGRFSYSFDLPLPEIVTFSSTKTGYADTTAIVELRGGTVATPLITMRKNTTGGGGGIIGGGSAKTIAFLGANPQDVSVYGVGGKETVTLDWEVRDSVGTPINGAHAATLTFAWTDLGATVAPKEYVLPTSVVTNAVGRASTSFTSGTKSGVVQVTASTVVNGTTIISSPVRIVVHAGFADQTHFTIATVAHNLPAWTFTAFLRNQISVLVGDKYSNPCDVGTALYFRTSAGVVQASAFTNKDGQASVDLISGNPLPMSPYSAAPAPSPLDTMFHWVVAKTIGEGGSTVTDSTLLLWTGHTQITLVTPDTFHIVNGGSRTFAFSVTDEYGHPLGAGTTISVTAVTPPPPDPNTPANQVQCVFDPVTLPDTQSRGRGTTDFSFAIVDGTTNIDQATAVKVTITVASPNGNRSLTFGGTLY